MGCLSTTDLCDVQSCSSWLCIGKGTPGVEYFVHIEKLNGAAYIHAATAGSDGNIIIPLTQPNASFYNEFDGQYTIYALLPINGYYNCECNEAILQTPNGNYSRGTFQFVRSSGVAMEQQSLNVSC